MDQVARQQRLRPGLAIKRAFFGRASFAAADEMRRRWRSADRRFAFTPERRRAGKLGTSEFLP
jgi:hypothetical protein